MVQTKCDACSAFAYKQAAVQCACEKGGGKRGGQSRLGVFYHISNVNLTNSAFFGLPMLGFHIEYGLFYLNSLLKEQQNFGQICLLMEQSKKVNGGRKCFVYLQMLINFCLFLVPTPPSTRRRGRKAV